MSLDERSDALDEKIANSPVDNSVAILIRDARRSKRRVRILMLSVFLDVLLTIGLATISYKTNELAHLAQSNKAAVIANCQVSNDSRKNNRALWDYILAFPPSQPVSPERQVEIDKFKDFVNKTFAERDCQAEVNKSVIIKP